MFQKKQICPKCKTGQDSYLLDEHSEICPYIGGLKNGKCPFFVPLEKSSKKQPLQNEKKSGTSSENF